MTTSTSRVRICDPRSRRRLVTLRSVRVGHSAVADPGRRFTGRSGDLSGSTTPASLVVDGARSIPAAFELISDVDPPVVSGVDVVASAWSRTTDESAVGDVAYGPAAYESGSVATAGTATSQSVVLSGLAPATTYHFRITATDPAGNASATGDATFTTPKAPLAAVTSDDFVGPALDTGLWTVVDPVGDGTVWTDGSRLLMTVPSGASHDAPGSNASLRALQVVADTDFEVEAKFDSVVSSKYQSDGIIVEASPGNYLRFEYLSVGSSTRVFAASTVDNDSMSRANAKVTPPGASPRWLRVTRAGDQWTAAYFFDDIDFTTFTHELAVTSVGPFAGSHGSASPAYTTIVDRFFDTAAPVTPED